MLGRPLSCGFRPSGGPGRGHELGGLGAADLAGQERERLAQVLDGVDVGELAAAQDRVDDRSSVATVVVPEKEVVLPGQRDRDKPVLGGRVVDRDRPVKFEATQRLLVSEEVADSASPVATLAAYRARSDDTTPRCRCRSGSIVRASVRAGLRR